MSINDELDMLDVVHELLGQEREFYNVIRLLDGSTRSHIVAAHMRNTSNIIALLRNYQPITNMVLNIPLSLDASGNFFDNIPIVPSNQQITTAVERDIAVHDSTCSICQEAVTVATRIRSCGHCFHSQCIDQWFTMNPRCPMCRHDIRLRVTTNVINNVQNSSLHTNQE